MNNQINHSTYYSTEKKAEADVLRWISAEHTACSPFCSVVLHGSKTRCLSRLHQLDDCREALMWSEKRISKVGMLIIIRFYSALRQLRVYKNILCAPCTRFGQKLKGEKMGTLGKWWKKNLSASKYFTREHLGKWMLLGLETGMRWARLAGQPEGDTFIFMYFSDLNSCWLGRV